MMKNKTVIITLIIILSIIAICLTLFMISMLNNNFNFSFFKQNYKVSNKLVLDKVYDFDSNSVKINADASNIYIKTSLDEKTKVVIYSDEKNTSVEAINNEISITSKSKGCIGFCINYKTTKIEVYLPKDYNKEINIINKYGDVNIEDLKNANINIEEDCGDVIVREVNNANITNKYGDIKINKSNTANIKAEVGDIEIGTVNNITVKNAYGDIEISKVNNYLNVKNNCGDINIDNVFINKDSYIKGNFGDIEIGKTNKIYIDANTDLGNTNINNNYHKSDITLKIENDCGDIEVDN